MFCPNCGNQLTEGAAFCSSCGSKISEDGVSAAPQQPAYAAPQPQAQPVQPKANDPELDALAGSVLARGITGLALASIGIPGVIVSAKAKNLAAEYQRKAGSLSGRAKVGNILARVGFPLGWGMTGFYVLYAIILMATIA